jgi:hypothetical protein
MHGAQTALLLGGGRILYLAFPPENADQRFKRASTFSRRSTCSKKARAR